VSWGAQGTQTISLTVTDNGCQATASSTVNISDSLHPLFSLNPSGLACQGVPVSVSLTGTPSGTATYSWNFNGGTVLSGAGPGPYSVSWGSNGNKTVTLTVTDGGCSGSTFQSIDILNAATANAGADIQICPGISGNLGAAPTGGYTYSWTPAWGLSSTSIANPTVTIPSNPTGHNIDTF
jgi:PKD repeat protein